MINYVVFGVLIVFVFFTAMDMESLHTRLIAIEAKLNEPR